MLLLGIGYFIKRGFDIKSKKVEINHALYQQSRLLAVSTFFENYAKAEMMWNQIAIYDILSRKFAPKEIDNLIFPTINELDKNLLELMIFFDESDYLRFKTIVANIKLINRKLSELYFDCDYAKTYIEKSTDFDLIKIRAFRENEIILQGLNTILKNIYKT